MRVLITGVTGFVGSHLVDYINTLGGCQVFGTKRRRSPLDNLHSPVELIDCELTDYRSVENAIMESRPDRIFHLAAQSYVPQSWDAPEHTLDNNIQSTLNILEAILHCDPSIRLQVAGSSEEYGIVLPHECPITEEQPLRPLSPYGVSKVACDLLSRQYAKSYDLHVVVTRAFNHTGPRRGEVFATSNFAKQIAEIEAGKCNPYIQVGNLNARRDWTDVRDIVRAYWLALDCCDSGSVYNIASGSAVTIGDMLNQLLLLSTADIKITHDPSRMRPSDVPLLLGDSTAFSALTGWTPSIPFSQTLADLLNYWRSSVLC